MPNKPNFPIAISDISADWLESRLGDGFPGAKVQDFSVTQIGQGEGFMAALARVMLTGEVERRLVTRVRDRQALLTHGGHSAASCKNELLRP